MRLGKFLSVWEGVVLEFFADTELESIAFPETIGLLTNPLGCSELLEIMPHRKPIIFPPTNTEKLLGPFNILFTFTLSNCRYLDDLGIS